MPGQNSPLAGGAMPVRVRRKIPSPSMTYVDDEINMWRSLVGLQPVMAPSRLPRSWQPLHHGSFNHWQLTGRRERMYCGLEKTARPDVVGGT